MSIFNSISAKRPKLNSFDLSHEKKLSCNFGSLIPILCQEVVPGDKFRINSELFCRVAPMIAPVMHRANIYTHFFFVPNRLIWNEWKDFITGGKDGNATPVMPHITAQKHGSMMQAGQLLDYLGYPVSKGAMVSQSTLKMSSLPIRAYNLIYNEYYRDQNLTSEVKLPLGSGEESPLDIITLATLKKRCWEKDYFTSALPFAQRGGDVTLPLAGQAAVQSLNGYATVVDGAGDPMDSAGNLCTTDGSGRLKWQQGGVATDASIGNLVADMSEVTSATINDIRRATRLQEWLEKSARGGSRYIEQILSHFGVTSSDARLQRPEFLGGGKTPLVISEVLQTSSTDNTTPQGNMSGHAIAVGNTHRISKSFEEHGFIICILSAVPRTAYQQGCPKMLQRMDKFDYYWPSFANLGEQEVKTSELYFDKNSDTVNDSVFGYQSRYSEYKYCPSTVHGDFKTNLSFWHMGRMFDQAPALNKNFVEIDNTTPSRVFADQTSTHKLWIQIYHDMKAIRPMPKFGTPIL